MVIDRLSRPIYKDQLTKWKSSEEENSDNSEERHRSCNISATQQFVDRIDFLIENDYVNYSSRSEFLRDIILEKIVKIEERNQIERGANE